MTPVKKLSTIALSTKASKVPMTRTKPDLDRTKTSDLDMGKCGTRFAFNACYLPWDMLFAASNKIGDANTVLRDYWSTADIVYEYAARIILMS